MPKLLKSFLLTLFGALTLLLVILLLVVAIKFLGGRGTAVVFVLTALFGLAWSIVHQEIT